MKYLNLGLILILVACQSKELTKEQLTKVLIHGHRGSRGTHPENTIPAFQEAVSAGANVLELDLHMTKDDKLVLSHDAHIPSKLCVDKEGKTLPEETPFIRNLTLKQVQIYDCGALQNPRFSDQKPIPKTKMPTLEEVFQWAKSNAKTQEFNIETKMDAKEFNPDPEKFAKAVISLMKKYGMVKRSILQSFDFTTLNAAKKIEPSLRLSALFEFEKKFCEETVKLGFPIVSPNHELMTPEEVAKCKAAKIQIAPWTVNDESSWYKVIEMGVDAIITDYPRKLAAYLKK